MGKAKSKAGKGQGWFLQSARHSRARKTGKAGGIYAGDKVAFGDDKKARQ